MCLHVMRIPKASLEMPHQHRTNPQVIALLTLIDDRLTYSEWQ